MSYTEKEKEFTAKYAEEIALVANANKVDMRVGTLMVLNNAKFLDLAMRQQGYKPGLSVDLLVRDALEVEAAKIKPAEKK